MSKFFKIVFLSGFVFLSSCQEETEKAAATPRGGETAVNNDTLFCKNWGGSNICLQTQGTGSGATATPTLTFKGLDRINGNVRLFSDSGCTTTIGSPVTATTATIQVTAPAQKTFSAEYYAQYTHTDNTISPCLGPVLWEVEEKPSLALSSENFSSLTLDISGLAVLAGSVQLFSDSTCATPASDPVDADQANLSINANTLTGYGSFEFYAQHTDPMDEVGDCIGPINHDFISGLQDSDPVIALDSANNAIDDDPTPTIKLTNLEFESGKIQLFSDETCTTAASGEENYSYSSSGTTISADSLNTFDNYSFWGKVTEGIENQSRCIGPVVYEYAPTVKLETLMLALTSPTSPLNSDSTPTFSVSGLVVQNGNVQLFSDSSCTTAASATVTASSATASITANALSAGNHQFYVQHTDTNSNKGDCFGSVAYTMEILTLALSSPSTSPALDTTPTFSMSGLVVHNGTVQLFSDSACTTAASATAAVSSATVSIVANSLTTSINQFYVRHTDSSSNQGDCFGPVAYTGEILTLALSSPSTPLGFDSTPTLSVTGLLFHNGTVQLFSDSSCTTTASATVTVSSGTASITANALDAENYRLYYVQHTDSSNNKGNCFGGISYGYYEPSISAGGIHTCALTSGGKVKCWGFGGSGLLGNDDTSNKDHPVDVVDGRGSRIALANIVQVSAGYGHTCAVTSAGGVKCWGKGGHGQLGNDASSSKEYPVDVVDGDGSVTALTGIVQVSAGDGYTCALTTSGGVKCWGDGGGGVLGNDAYSDKDHPVTVVDADGSSTSLANIVQVSAGDDHTCAVTSAGGVKCWGRGSNGKLGNDASSSKEYPVDVVDGNGSNTALTGIIQVSAGDDHTCAVTSAGGVKCWGKGGHGQLGNDASSSKEYPVDVVDGNGSNTALTGIIQVSAGDDHTCAVTSGSNVKCWGYGFNGRLGNDASSSKDYPVDVVDGDDSTTALANIVQVSAGGSHTCALTSTGGVKCWGGHPDGTGGSLGDDCNPGTIHSACTDKDHPVDVVDGDGSSTPLDITP